MSQPVLPLLPVEARSVGPSVGLVEGSQGGVVLVFGLVTHAWAAGDELARRLAAVQLVNAKLASQAEVADAFAVNTSTMFRWIRAFAQAGTGGLVRERTGPRGRSKLTGQVTDRIRGLRGSGLTIRAIAVQTGVSTATVRVALGLVPARPGRPERRAQASQDAARRSFGDHHDHGLDDQVLDDQVLDDQVLDDPVLEDVLEDEWAANSDADGGGDDLEVGGGDGLDVGGGGGGRADAPDTSDLVVLARPVPRAAERAAARAGDLVEAPVALTEGAHLPLAGLLLVLPALEMTGLLPVADGVFGPMRKGFYRLRATLMTLVFLALLRQPRAEHLTRLPPADLGRLLGLDRAPEVKTLRRKLSELAGHGKGAGLLAALGAHHAAVRPETVGFLYVDGHVRVYSGSRQLPKAHIARMRIAGPATEETWVADSGGDPVLVLIAPPSASLAAELRRTLPDLRALVDAAGPGPDGRPRRCTVVFDRGGYSPAVFAELLAAGFDLITYYKGNWTRTDPAAFTPTRFLAPDGTVHHYRLAERTIELAVPAHPAHGTTPARPAGVVTLRMVVRASDDGHQTPILASRADLTAGELAWRMSARWRQENYFKYGREHFALDALDSYADGPADLNRPVPSPTKTDALLAVTAARAELARRQAEQAAAIEQATRRARQPGSGGTATVDPHALAQLQTAQAALHTAQDTSAATISHLPLGQVRPDTRQLETERKLLTHAIRMSAYNAESALARLLRPHYARGDDEARALLREAFTLPGDLEIIDQTLHVRLDPASAPRRSRALAALCTELTATQTRYPSTNITIAYSIKGHPNPA